MILFYRGVVVVVLGGGGRGRFSFCVADCFVRVILFCGGGFVLGGWFCFGGVVLFSFLLPGLQLLRWLCCCFCCCVVVYVVVLSLFMLLLCCHCLCCCCVVIVYVVVVLSLFILLLLFLFAARSMRKCVTCTSEQCSQPPPRTRWMQTCRWVTCGLVSISWTASPLLPCTALKPLIDLTPHHPAHPTATPTTPPPVL